ncbi:MAG: hypothetical protein WCJ35_03580 [Planctomycetota bacterium]
MSFRLGNFLPHVSAHNERDLFAWSLLAAIILLSILAMPFFSGGLYTADELGNYHLPARAFYAEQLAHGESFDWMPDVYSGFYLTGEGQVGTYHPLHRFLYRFLPFPAALGWEYLCSYPLMLSGMYFLLRRRLRRRDAAMVGSLAFTFSSFNLLHFVHPNAVAAVAHIPWLLAMIDIVMVDAKRWKVALAQAFLALLTGSQMLLGCPQYVWFSLLTEAGFTLFLVLTRRYSPRDGCETMPTCRVCIGCRRNSSSRVILAKGIGLLVGAVQLLPTLEALFQSTRNGDQVPAGATLHPINLIQLVAPYLPVDRVFGGNARELSLYVGAVPLMLALWVLVRHSDLGPLKRLAQVTAAFAVAALLLALGSQGQIVRLQNSIPWTAWFQFSCRYTVLFQFSVAVLAAIGFVLVERDAREKQKIQRHLPPLTGQRRAAALWRQFEILGATVLVSLAVAMAGLILQSGHQVASPLRILVGPLLMAAAALLVIAASQGVRGALVGLILFMAADLGYYGLSCTLDEPNTKLDGLLARTVAPPGQCDSRGPDAQRVFAPPAYGHHESSAIGNQMTLAGWSRTDGYAALEPSKSLNYFQLPALRVASTRWVHRSPSTSVIEGLTPYDENWMQVPDPLPLVRLVTHVVQSNNPALDLAKIDIRREALCQYALALPPGKPGIATLARHRAGQMAVKVCCSSPQLLVIAESYHSGWQCMIDGSPGRVYRVNGDFLGCVVEPGNSEVRLEFRPDSLFRGRIVTLAGLGLIGFCLFTGAARRELAVVEKIGLNRGL